MLSLALILLGAVGFRIRGGMTEGWRWQLRGQVARLVWAATCAIAAAAVGVPWPYATALIPAMWIAATLPVGGAIDMGRNDGSLSQDFGIGTLHGIALGACASGVLALSGAARWYMPIIGGSTWGACYALTWLRPSWPELVRLNLGQNGNPPEAAELLFGAVFAGALLHST